MSRKHFQQLAILVADSSNFLSDAQREELARELARFCMNHNNNFDREKFLVACEVE